MIKTTEKLAKTWKIVMHLTDASGAASCGNRRAVHGAPFQHFATLGPDRRCQQCDVHFRRRLAKKAKLTAEAVG